jgi:hypothetical protein
MHAKNLINKICSIDSLKDSCFVIDNLYDPTGGCLIEVSNFFIVNQVSNIVLMPYDMYKKLLLVFNTVFFWSKSNLVKNSEISNFNITTLPKCNYYSSLFSSSINDINQAITEKSDNDTISGATIGYCIAISIAISGASFALGYFIHYCLYKRKAKQYLRVS